MDEDMFILDLLSGGGVHDNDSDGCDSAASPGGAWQPNCGQAPSSDELAGFSLNMWDFAIMQSSFGDLQSYDSATLIGMYQVDAPACGIAGAHAPLMRRRSDSGYSTSTRSPGGSSSCGSGSPLPSLPLPPAPGSPSSRMPPSSRTDELLELDLCDADIDCGSNAGRKRVNCGGGGGGGGSARSKIRVEKIRKSRSRQLQLWEFLYQLLHETDCQALAWENRSDGTFRIALPSALAEAWGRHRNRSNMTYEKMSRTLRYYYEKQIITKVTGKQHTYKFHYDRFPL